MRDTGPSLPSWRVHHPSAITRCTFLAMWRKKFMTPHVHFFGHTGQPFQRRTDENGVTVCSKLSDFEWEESDRGGRLKEGCLGVLRWQDSNQHRFDVVNAPWIKEYTPHTWRYL